MYVAIMGYGVVGSGVAELFNKIMKGVLSKRQTVSARAFIYS
jgi:homoserine dehydrogenase